MKSAGWKTPCHGWKVAREQWAGWGCAVTERGGCCLETRKRHGLSSLKPYFPLQALKYSQTHSCNLDILRAFCLLFGGRFG